MYRDGPLRVRPPEEIRYGVGKCVLGAVLVACSDKGIASVIVRDKAPALLHELRERFPKANLLLDQEEKFLKKTIQYIGRPAGRFPLALDLRGTEFQQRVWREVQRIPFGQTSTYARIAQAIGAPKSIRAVASSCTRCWFAFAVPCHRVLHSGAAKAGREGRRYRWVAYEAKLPGRIVK